jgi:hypothetical protein
MPFFCFAVAVAVPLDAACIPAELQACSIRSGRTASMFGRWMLLVVASLHRCIVASRSAVVASSIPEERQNNVACSAGSVLPERQNSIPAERNNNNSIVAFLHFWLLCCFVAFLPLALHALHAACCIVVLHFCTSALLRFAACFAAPFFFALLCCAACILCCIFFLKPR